MIIFHLKAFFDILNELSCIFLYYGFFSKKFLVFYRRAGAVMLKNLKFGQFRVIQNFALRTNQGTHPLIESLSQRLKMAFLSP